MPRNMSFSMTTEAVRNRTKTVTRRLGWWDLRPGDVLMAVEKGMGLKKGEKVKRLGLIRVRGVAREPLSSIIDWGPRECAAEGFPDMDPRAFIVTFALHNRCDRDTIVNRIEFEYVDEEQTP